MRRAAKPSSEAPDVRVGHVRLCGSRGEATARGHPTSGHLILCCVTDLGIQACAIVGQRGAVRGLIGVAPLQRRFERRGQPRAWLIAGLTLRERGRIQTTCASTISGTVRQLQILTCFFAGTVCAIRDATPPFALTIRFLGRSTVHNLSEGGNHRADIPTAYGSSATPAPR